MYFLIFLGIVGAVMSAQLELSKDPDYIRNQIRKEKQCEKLWDRIHDLEVKDTYTARKKAEDLEVSARQSGC